jgi:hypothetical protein
MGPWSCSLCSLTCKYMGVAGNDWDLEFMTQTRLDGFVQKEFAVLV